MKLRRKKSDSDEILAAGGIVMLAGRPPLIAVVQRRKDGGWVLPKGKLKPREKAFDAARREAAEETGRDVSVHEFLGAVSYPVNGKPKIVKFWRMRCATGKARKPTADIEAVEWLPLEAAIGRLTQPLERAFLSQVGWRALKLARTSARSRSAKLSGSRIAPEGNGRFRSLESQAPVPASSGSPLVMAPGLLQRLWQRFLPDPAVRIRGK